MTTNTLYYGDNLEILRNRAYFPDECVDLIYLDPPFNSARTYNVLFKDESGSESESQIVAFDDTWHWGHEAQEAYYHLVTHGNEQVSRIISALKDILGNTPMSAYIMMMSVRLVELHRILNRTGSVYLHCDPTASHYLKIVLDAIFGVENYQNEISWQRTNAKGLASKRLPKNRDIIFFYTKSDKWTWNSPYKPHDPEYVKKFYRHVEPETGRVYSLADLTNPNKNRPNLDYEFLGIKRVWRWTKERMQKALEDGLIVQLGEGRVPRFKRYLDEQEGTPLSDEWIDIPPLSAQSAEKLGYPTQKPVKLLERIIAMSSNPGDVVLDPFCGCGTTIAASQTLGRNWIGIDITHLSIALQKYRLKDAFGDIPYTIIGEPSDIEGARQLATEDRYQFQWWALSLVRAKPVGGNEDERKGKKGRDRGIDGVINFLELGEKARRVIVQVKSGKVKSGDIRDLSGTLEREKATIAVFITLEEPTRDMIAEATSAGFYTPPAFGGDVKYRRIQIFTVEQLMLGATIDMPASHGTFKQAGRIDTDDKPTTMPLL